MNAQQRRLNKSVRKFCFNYGLFKLSSELFEHGVESAHKCVLLGRTDISQYAKAIDDGRILLDFEGDLQDYMNELDSYAYRGGQLHSMDAGLLHVAMNDYAAFQERYGFYQQQLKILWDYRGNS